MAENHVIWELGASRIRIGSHSFKLKSKPNKGAARRVELQQDVIMPPRSEMNLPTKVIGRLWEKTNDEAQWGTIPTAIQKGLCVSGTLVPDSRLQDVPVRAVNVTTEAIYLSARRNLADLQPVEVCEAKPVSTGQTPMKTRVTRENDVSTESAGIPEFMKTLIDHVHPSLSNSVVSNLRDILIEVQDVFSKSEVDLGLITLVKHRIDTGNAPPVQTTTTTFPSSSCQGDFGTHRQHASSRSNRTCIKSVRLQYRSCSEERPNI